MENTRWRLWAKALGQKEGRSEKEADRIAFYRTLIVVQAVLRNLFIVINIIKSWLSD